MGETLRYTVLDVFAERALEGNALAVFHDGRGLTTEQMQAIARETNLSETTFVLPRDEETERAEGVRVRIFTTVEELPFAGHPTLGTATWLHLRHPVLRGAPTVALQLDVGRVPVAFEPAAADRPGVFGTMRQNDPEFGAVVPHAELAVAAAIALADLDESLPVQMVTTGNPMCLVPLRSVEAAARLQVDQRGVRGLLDRMGAKFLYCVAPAEQHPGTEAQFHARMQFHGGEDPATGSAAGPAVAWLVRYGRVAPGRTITLRQGIEMARPSRLFASAEQRDGRITEVRVGGRTIPVAAGRLFLSGFTRFTQSAAAELPTL